MTPVENIADQQDRALARLLELGLAAAEKVQARLMAAEDDAVLGDLSLALNRASRNVRQTIALQMRAKRERRQEDQEVAAEDLRTGQARRSQRKAQLKATVERLIWNEYEYDHDDEDAEKLVDRLDDRVNEIAAYDDFTTGPIDPQIARLCEEFDIPAPPDPPPQGEVSLGAQRQGTEGVWEPAPVPPPSRLASRGAPPPPAGEDLSPGPPKGEAWRSSA